MGRQTVEMITSRVYGETFARYTQEEFLEFLGPLETRLAANGIDASVFRGKRCLDAGCGGGRGTVLMARAGASEVVALDLSERNVETTGRNAALFGLDNVTTRPASLLEIPYPDESFDVVWCNGVVHHTVAPDRALVEITRVLKVAGRLWLYLYGAGGIYWLMVEFIRRWLADVDMHTCLETLERLGSPTGRIAEFLDDWYVPNLKRYTHADVTARLSDLGITRDLGRLEGGMPYDTSVRRRDPRDRPWMGEGDLRYWAAKAARGRGGRRPLPDVGGAGSAYTDDRVVRSFTADFGALESATDGFALVHPDGVVERRVDVAAQLQTWLRDRFSGPAPFDGEAFRAQIRGHARGMASG
ncbi:MAG: class I SAM-dependent methyltransferase [Planctomycetota bacterium]|jgi:ubiquinone/menaquinone biosynthesis C-methylase UbiE